MTPTAESLAGQHVLLASFPCLVVALALVRRPSLLLLVMMRWFRLHDPWAPPPGLTPTAKCAPAGPRKGHAKWDQLLLPEDHAFTLAELGVAPVLVPRGQLGPLVSGLAFCPVSLLADSLKAQSPHPRPSSCRGPRGQRFCAAFPPLGKPGDWTTGASSWEAWSSFLHGAVWLLAEDSFQPGLAVALVVWRRYPVVLPYQDGRAATVQDLLVHFKAARRCVTRRAALAFPGKWEPRLGAYAGLAWPRGAFSGVRLQCTPEEDAFLERVPRDWAFSLGSWGCSWLRRPFVVWVLEMRATCPWRLRVSPREECLFLPQSVVCVTGGHLSHQAWTDGWAACPSVSRRIVARRVPQGFPFFPGSLNN